MPKIYYLYLIHMLLISKIANAADVCLQIKGLSGALEKNISSQLSAIQKNNVIPNRYFYMRIEGIVKESLKSLGYYRPTITFNLSSPLKKNKCSVLIICINPGKPVRISNTNIILRGEARTDQEYLSLLNKRPTTGSILNHRDFNNFKKTLTDLSLQKGYFDSIFNRSQLSVLLSKHQAFWDIDYNSGQRYRFGDITFKNSQIRSEYLKRLIPFKEGTFFESKKLAELNHRLSATGWFRSVVIIPEFSKRQYAKKILPLYGIISPNAKNIIETGIGYSTDVGPHVKILWKKPWINSYGHNMTNRINISIPEQYLDLNYKIPIIKNPLDQYYLIKGELKRIILDNTELNFGTLSISRYWKLSNWKYSINLCCSLDHFTRINTKNNNMFFYSGTVISRIRSHGNQMPIWGDYQHYSVYYSSKSWNSNTSFIAAQMRHTWIRTVFNRHRFIIRGSTNWTKSNKFANIPVDLRLSSVDNYNIRGYKYKPSSLGENDRMLFGVSKILIGSLEYQYNIRKKWWSTIFIDGGKGINNVNFITVKTGVGMGIRWRSPIGPIKFDCAIPVYNKGKYNLHFYIGLGPEL